MASNRVDDTLRSHAIRHAAHRNDIDNRGHAKTLHDSSVRCGFVPRLGVVSSVDTRRSTRNVFRGGTEFGIDDRELNGMCDYCECVMSKDD